MKSVNWAACGLFAVGVACVQPAFSPAVAQGSEAIEASIDDTAKRFGARSSVLDITLSPSGDKIAWIAPGPGHSEVLRVYDLNAGESIRQIASNDEMYADMTGCEFATNDRLVCEIFGMGKRDGSLLVPFTRMFAIDADGSAPLPMNERQSWRALGFNQNGGDIIALDVAGEEGNILVTRNYIKERTAGTRIANEKTGLGVDRFDVSTGKRRVEEQPDDGASYYLADENGDVRMKVRALSDRRGFLTGERVYMVREPGGSWWEQLGDVTHNGQIVSDFSPIAVDAQRNVLFGFVTIDGFRSVIEIALSGSPEATIAASRSDVDVDGLMRIGRQRRVVGVSYATEKRSVEYFDEELAKLARDLGEALPNQPLINIAGASADESKLLIIASSDTDPGMVYLYDKATRQLKVLLGMRDHLVDRSMGKMQPVTYPASDGTQIPSYLTLPAGSDGKNLPAIVLPHGGPAARDYWGFDWLVQFFSARGYAVLQPNYRGSSGYGEAWFGRNGYQSWDIAIGDVNDAGRWLVSQGIADPEKLAIAGWSYGGYAALQSQVVEPELYKAVVAIAPVTDLEYLRDDAREYTSFRYRDEQLGEGPHIAAGSPRRHAERFSAPVALYHGTRDINVDVRHSRGMEKALQGEGKRVSYTEFDGLQHDLGDSDARARMLESIDRFLSSSLGG